MDDGKKYLSRTDRILLLALEKKDTKGWHNHPSVRKRSERFSLPTKVNNGNVGDRRKQANVEGIIAKLTNVAEDNNTLNNVEINEEFLENNVVNNVTNNDKIDKELLENYEVDNVPDTDKGVTVQVSSVVNENIVHENRAVDENSDNNNGSTTGESSADDENSGRNNGPNGDTRNTYRSQLICRDKPHT